MSPEWLWRSAGECRGPLTAAELAELLRSRKPDPADEVQPFGASRWTPLAALADVVVVEAAAIDATADLLLAADELRRDSESAARPIVEVSAPPGRSNGNSGRDLRNRLWTPRSLLMAALVALTALVIVRRSQAPPSNAAVCAELSRWHASLCERRAAETSVEDERRRQNALRSLRRMIAELESATQLQPLLSIGADPAAADAVLARRELLCAARDLHQLFESIRNLPALEKSFREHMDAAVVARTREAPLNARD